MPRLTYHLVVIWAVGFKQKKSVIDNFRALFSSGVRNSRTKTRMNIGGVAVRWESGYEDANPILRHRITQIENVPVTQTAVLEQIEALLRPIDN